MDPLQIHLQLFHHQVHKVDCQFEQLLDHQMLQMYLDLQQQKLFLLQNQYPLRQ